MGAAEAQWERSDSPSSNVGELWPTRVLLAEDDPDLRILLADTLRQDEYKVLEAKDGEQLLDLVASQLLYPRGSPGILDLIISDIRMPGPNGLWALATLRHMDWVTPFVVITAYSDANTRAEAERLGAAAFMPKPIDLEVFRATVNNLAGPATPTLGPRDRHVHRNRV